MSLTFTDDELLHYFKLRAEADEYLNLIIRMKRAEQYMENKNDT